MGRYVKTRIVTDGLIYLNDAGNSKSYSGVGTAIKNLVGYGATNTSFNQTFVSSGTSSYFVSTGSTSYISNTNVSVSASTGRGFTICMMIKPETLTNNNGWNYWFQQQSETNLIEFGVISDEINSPSYPLNGGNGTAGWQMKDNIKIEGQKVFTSVGTTTWTVPVGVTSITAVCVGGGGGAGGFGAIYPGSGGGGGGLSFGSTISVNPGDVLYIRVGSGGTGGISTTSGAGGETSGTAGESSYIKTGSHSGTSLLEGGGGGGGGIGYLSSGGSGGISTGISRTNGGAGGKGGSQDGGSSRGSGGGGAGGYTGVGGTGGNGGSLLPFVKGGSGSGGGAGGGSASSNSSTDEVFNPGGGVGIFSQGDSGLGGTGSSSGVFFYGGGPGSNGQYGSASTGNGANQRSVGGLYGGGGGAKFRSISSSFVRDGGNGGQGAVRIVWGSGRSYPSTNTANPIPITQYAELNGGIYFGGGASTKWNFVVCGVTTDYYTFISTNGSTKTLGSSNDWSTAPQINLDKIFGTGTSNYSCLWNNCMIYNRELTNEEIQINFEAFRRKFNL